MDTNSATGATLPTSAAPVPTQGGNARVRARAVAQAALGSLVAGWGGGDWEQDQRAFATAVLALEHPKRFGVTPRMWLRAIMHMNDAVWRAANSPPVWFQVGPAVGAGAGADTGAGAVCDPAPVPSLGIRLPGLRLGPLRGYTYTVWFCLDATVGAGAPLTASLGGYFDSEPALEVDASDEAGGQEATSASAAPAAAAAAAAAGKADPRRPTRFLKAAFKSVFKTGGGGPAAAAPTAAPSSAPTTPAVSGGGGGAGGSGWAGAQSDAGVSSAGAGEPAGTGGLPAGAWSLLRLESRGDGGGVEVLLVPAAAPAVAAATAGGGATPAAAATRVASGGGEHQLWHLVVIPGRGAGGAVLLPPLDASSVVRVAPGAWHSVVVTQAQPFLKRSRARCYFDGAAVTAWDVAYPSQKDLDVCSVGAGLIGACAFVRACACWAVGCSAGMAGGACA
jgi:hypothetical protein